jgi:cobalamin biosynthesis Mg chelatase CobN
MPVKTLNKDMHPSPALPVSWTPVPDPTLLTTAALQREVAALKELLLMRIDGIVGKQEDFLERLITVPVERDKQIGYLKEVLMTFASEREKLVSERFNGVQRQFEERDTRSELWTRDNKLSVDAALTAAKELVNKQNEAFTASIAKSEAATSKQIDQQGLLIQTSNSGLSGKIDDVKDRITALESEKRGGTESGDHGRSNLSIIVAIAAVVVSVIALFFMAYRLPQTPQAVQVPIVTLPQTQK